MVAAAEGRDGDDDALHPLPTVRIPIDEVELRFSRSGGPGGQHVNTSSTRVELRFAVDASPSLSDEHKEAVRRRLGRRLTADGVLVLHASEHRSQLRNRAAALQRLERLLAEALAPRTPRRPTAPSRGAREARLGDKRRRSELKASRRERPDPE